MKFQSIGVLILLSFLSISCFDDSEELSSNAEANELTNSIGMQFVWVKPGVFTMGSPTTEQHRSNDEGPQHSVTISKGFWMGQFEVTQGEWAQVMGGDSLLLRGLSNSNASADKPVEKVSWDDCQTFIKKLMNLEHNGNYSLPTEAQWEYCCRAGSSTAYHSGDNLSTSIANYQFDKNTTTDVGSYPPNQWGLYDMHGNVNEWCSDWYDEKTYGQNAVKDPSGPKTNSNSGQPLINRVYRSGCWNNSAENCRAADRNSAKNYLNFPGFGFRLVKLP